MRISSTSADELVAKSWGVSTYLMGGLLGLIGLSLLVPGIAAGSLPVWGTGLVLTLAGALVVALAKRELLTASKSTGTITVVVVRLVGRKQAAYQFDQVSGVRTVQTYRRTATNISAGSGGLGQSRQSTEMKLFSTTQLLMADGTSVVIEKVSVKAGGGLLLGRRSEGIGRPLADFIGKPYQLVSPMMNPADLVAGVVNAFRGGNHDAAASVASTTPVAPVAAAPVVAATPEAPVEPTDSAAPIEPPSESQQ